MSDTEDFESRLRTRVSNASIPLATHTTRSARDRTPAMRERGSLAATPGAPAGSGDADALARLFAMLASGEIDGATFDRLKAQLTGGTSVAAPTASPTATGEQAPGTDMNDPDEPDEPDVDTEAETGETDSGETDPATDDDSDENDDSTDTGLDDEDEPDEVADSVDADDTIEADQHDDAPHEPQERSPDTQDDAEPHDGELDGLETAAAAQQATQEILDNQARQQAHVDEQARAMMAEEDDGDESDLVDVSMLRSPQMDRARSIRNTSGKMGLGAEGPLKTVNRIPASAIDLVQARLRNALFASCNVVLSGEQKNQLVDAIGNDAYAAMSDGEKVAAWAEVMSDIPLNRMLTAFILAMSGTTVPGLDPVTSWYVDILRGTNFAIDYLDALQSQVEQVVKRQNTMLSNIQSLTASAQTTELQTSYLIADRMAAVKIARTPEELAMRSPVVRQVMESSRKERSKLNAEVAVHNGRRRS